MSVDIERVIAKMMEWRIMATRSMVEYGVPQEVADSIILVGMGMTVLASFRIF